MMNEKTRSFFVGFIVGVIIATICTAIWILHSSGGMGGTRAVSEINKINQREAGESVRGLKQSVDSLNEGIDAIERASSGIEASNNRLEEYIMGAEGTSTELGVQVGNMGKDINRAIEIYQTITGQNEGADNIPGRGPSASGGIGSMGRAGDK